jgi:hypothetical protein
VETLTFDWISANPPFIPDPAHSQLQLFQAGGASGEEITRSILQGAHKHLDVGGTLAIVTNAPERRGENQIAKLRGWLKKDSNWGITHLVRQRVARDSYIAAIIDRNRIFSENPALEAERVYAGQFMEHLKHYERDNIESMLEVVYLIQKLPSTTTPWSIELELGAAVCSRDHNRYMADWQEALRVSHGASWAQHPHYALAAGTYRSGSKLFVNTPLEGLKQHDLQPHEQELASQLSSGQPVTNQQALRQLAVWGALTLR